VAGEPAGKRVAVVVWRNGSRKTVSVEMAYPKDKPRTAPGGNDGRPIAGNLESLLHGVQITSLTDDLRRKLALPNDVQGVVILDLDERSLAAREGLQRDDLIEQVERHYVGSPGEVDRLIQQAAAKERSAVLILVRRGGSELYLAVKAAKAGKYLGDPLFYHPGARSA
jgi:serine protease Do